MMKQNRVLIGVLLISIFNPIKSVFAHNGIDEQSSANNIYDQWNLILAGALVVILVANSIYLKRNKTYIRSLSFSFLLYAFFI